MNRFSYKNILVAGGTGLLGTSLTKRFTKFKNIKLISSFVTQNPKKILASIIKNMIF